VGIWGKAPKAERFFAIKYFDIGGFIIDLRVGRFSPLLAKMMLEKLGYTMTQPKTQY